MSRSVARRRCTVLRMLLFLVLLNTNALHHMKRPPHAHISQRAKTVPLVIKNMCSETIYPGIVTQAGTPPSSGGFRLQTGQQMNLTVGADWQGRVWGRTNCSFNSQGTGPANAGGNNGGGRACDTGDCGGIVNCKATVCASSYNHWAGKYQPMVGRNTCEPGGIYARNLKWSDILRHLTRRRL